ncbi:helix-turn-helix transcriptional regulator [Aeromonas caviae]|jgi:predicted DNA-binding transcriptional regulator AlpA|nr:transcriptional regulator [Aeromonas sp. ASNIH7]
MHVAGNEGNPMLISTSQLSTRLGVSRSTVERLRRNPTACFPKPIHIGPNSVRYDLAEIDQWLESRRQGEAKA